MRETALRVAALLAFATFAGGWSFFDPFHQHVENGNLSAEDGKTDDALARYGAAGKENPASPIPDFNEALALAKGGRVDEAKGAFAAAEASSDPKIASAAHYNHGNLLLQQKDTPGAVDQYLQSLDLDPSNADARRNLEIALRRREEEERQKQQQEQNPQQKNDEQKDEKGDPQDSKDGKDESTPEEQKKQQEEKAGDDSTKTAPDSSQAASDSSSSGTPPPGGEPQPQEGRLSREDAARLLNAIANDELRVLRMLDEKKEGEEGVAGHDW